MTLDKNSDRKFDVVIMNPPFNLGIKFFSKILDISDKAVTIQPSNWLLTEKQNKSIINKLENVYSNIELLNGNEYFDAGFAQDISINYIDNTKDKTIILNGKHYNNFSDIKKYSLDEKIETFAKTLGEVKDSIWDHIKGTTSYYKGYEKNPNQNWWIIKIPEIRGHVSNTNKKESVDFYSIISNDNNFINKVKGQYKDIKDVPNRQGNKESGYFAFDNKNELDNFIRYIKTDFVRTYLMLGKYHNNQFRGCSLNIQLFVSIFFM